MRGCEGALTSLMTTQVQKARKSWQSCFALDASRARWTLSRRCCTQSAYCCAFAFSCSGELFICLQTTSKLSTDADTESYGRCQSVTI